MCLPFLDFIMMMDLSIFNGVSITRLTICKNKINK